MSIREKIENASIEERIAMLDLIYDKWIIKNENSEDVIFFFLRVLENFELNINNLNMSLFDSKKTKFTTELTYLRIYFETIDVNSINDDVFYSYKVKFNKIFRAIVDGENLVRALLNLQNSMSENYNYNYDSVFDMKRYQLSRQEDNTSWQNLLLFLKMIQNYCNLEYLSLDILKDIYLTFDKIHYILF